MDDRSVENFIKLLHLKGVGFKFLRGFYERYGTFGGPFEENLGRYLRENFPKRERDRFLSLLGAEERWKTLFTFLKEYRVEVIPFFDPRFPQALLNTGLSIGALFLMGKLPSDGFVVVGTRKASTGGKERAERFASFLARRGIPVVSGGAVGIDRAAHRGALSVGGPTGVILGEGLMPFISKNAPFVQQVIDSGGFILSQFPLPTPGAKWTYPQRNALIAYFGYRGTLVVEAPPKSGALITADYAQRFERPLFAYLGCTHNPVYGGNIELIKGCKAKLVTEPQELLKDAGKIPKRNSH